MGTDHIDDIRGATRPDEAPIPELPRDDGMCPLVQEAFDGVGDVADEVGRPLGVRRAGGRVACGEPGDALAHTVAFADAMAFANTGGLGNRRRKDRDDRGKEEGDGGELHCGLVLKTRDRELWVQRDKVGYTRDISGWSIDIHTGQGDMRYSRNGERKTISSLIQRQEGSIG